MDKKLYRSEDNKIFLKYSSASAEESENILMWIQW